MAILGAIDGLQRPVVESLHDRLAELLDGDEWDSDDKPPSITSFRFLVAFLARHNKLRAPALTISNDGNFVATWLKTQHDIVRLEFDGRGWVKWLVLLAPIGREEPAYKGTATMPAEKVKLALEPFDVWHWMTQASR